MVAFFALGKFQLFQVKYNGRITIFTMVLLTCLCSCNSRKEIKAYRVCQREISKFIADKWFYNPETKLYREGKGMIKFASTNFYLTDCLIGMDQKMVIQIFGKPSLINEYGMFYFYYEHCFTDFNKNCLGYMSITLDEKSKFKYLSFGSITTVH